jgi:hypothetical protein
MYVDNEIHEAELPGILRRLWEIAPYGLWESRADELALQERQNRHFATYFNERFAIERAIYEIVHHERQSGRLPRIESPLGAKCYGAFAFAATLVRVYQRLSEGGRKRLRASVGHYLKSPDGLVPLDLEMTTAGHLWSVGFDVQFADLEGEAQFDLLATKDGMELEIDCRVFSADVGRAVHRRRMLQVANQLERTLVSMIQRGEGAVVRIVLPGALHGNDDYVKAVVDLAAQALRKRASISDGKIGEVLFSEFHPERGPFGESAPPSQQALGAFLTAIVGASNIHAVSFHKPGEGVIIVTIESKRHDNIVDASYEQLKRKAKAQFSKRRPAALVVRLTDLMAGDIDLLGQQPGSGFWMIAERLFKGEDRQHLITVAFVAPARVLTRIAGPRGHQYQDKGRLFAIKNDNHPLAGDSRLRLTN